MKRNGRSFGAGLHAGRVARTAGVSGFGEWFRCGTGRPGRAGLVSGPTVGGAARP